MKNLLFHLVLLLLGALSLYQSLLNRETQYSRIVAPDTVVVSTDALLNRVRGILYYDEAPFSGYLVERYEEGTTKDRTPYYEGQAHGTARGWYPDGSLEYVRRYRAGKKEGIHTGWWENGQVQFLYRFKDDLHEGRAQSWFPDGSRYRDFNYVNGKEEGPQRMWNEDGTLRANYVIKNGRRYGLLGSKPCSNDY